MEMLEPWGCLVSNLHMPYTYNFTTPSKCKLCFQLLEQLNGITDSVMGVTASTVTMIG